jgi:opacity protein-like surface antigen
MRRALLVVFVALPAACASVPERHVPAWTGSSVADCVPAAPLATHLTAATYVPMQRREFQLDAATYVPLQPREFQLDSAMDLAAAPKDMGLGTSYTALRLGSINPEGDVQSLDAGFWGEIGFGRRILGVLGVEAVIGYFETEGSGGAAVQGVPLLINARLSVPILILEPYAGAGLGGMWANAEAGGFSSEDGFSAIWDAFIGIEVGLAGFSVGAEYRYVQSGDFDSPGAAGDFQMEGNVFLLTGRLPF